MFVKWVVILPLLVAFNKVTLQPITIEESSPRAWPLDPSECCPCPGSANGITPDDCPCRSSDDAEASASILLPALRAIQPFIKQADQKVEPRPLLQPEVGLASSVLETLRQATDEEYLDAIARDAARSAVNIIDSSLDPPLSSYDSQVGTTKNKVRIFLNTKGDDMDDNLPEPSHIQETRCVHSSLQSIHNKTPLKLSRPTPLIEFIELSPEPKRKLNSKSMLHRNLFDRDSGMGASNIQERVIEPNHNFETINLKSDPTLLNLFRNNNLKRTKDYSQGDNSLNKKNNIHLKLRELFDNLEVASEKSKIPVIDLKKYMSTTTRIPPLRVKSIEKPIYNNRPLLKDLLKLKDVELIPRNIIKNATTGKSSFPNLKLQSESSTLENFSSNVDNCKEDNDNIIPIVNKDIPIRSDITDTDISPTFSNPVFETIPEEVNRNNKQNFIPKECLTSSENSGISLPVGHEDNLYYGDTEIDQDFNKEQLLLGNCNEPIGESYMHQMPSDENHGSYNHELHKGQVQKMKHNKDILNEERHDDAFQIELLEDFDTPIVFDNNSFISKSDLNNNDIVKDVTTNDEHQKTLFDTIAQTSNNDLQIREKNNEINKIVSDCDSNFVSDDQKFSIRNEVINSLQQESSDGDMKLYTNSARGSLCDINENPSSLTFNDLQNMSNSILSLSECDQLKEENVNIQNNLNQIIDDCDFPTTLSMPVLETNSEENFEEKETENTPENTNGKMSDLLSLSSSENLCKLSPNDESSFNINEAELRNSEMRAEASEPESITETKLKSYNPTFPLIGNIIENDKNSKLFTKSAMDLKDIVKVNKHSDFLNNLKSKLEGIFSTTEKVITSDLTNTSADNVNESSNMDPSVAKFQNLNKLERMPQTLLRDFSQTEMSKNSYKNKSPIPKYVDRPLKTNSYNLLKFPLDGSTPFDNILDPSLSFSDLSDRLRSHTETTIQNVKDTLESTLRDSQNYRHGRPMDAIDSHDIMESISNRRDEMKDKLEAIHLDLNDRFSSFQQSILDHINLNPRGTPEFQESGTNGEVKAKYIPLKKEIPLFEASKFRNVKDKHDFWSHRVDGPKKKQNHSSKSFIASDAAENQNFNRKPSLQNPVSQSTSTTIPLFIPRPKVLKTSIDSTPKLTTDISSKQRSFKIPNLSEVTKRKPINLDGFLKSGRTSKLSEESYSTPKLSSRINLPVKSLKTNAAEINKKLPKDYLLNKYSKTSLDRNNQPLENQKFRSEFPKSQQSLASRNLMGDDRQSTTKQESLLSRIKEGRPRMGSKSNDEQIMSPTSHMEKINTSQNDGLRLVEPMKENVPYKCKLICYKD